MNELELQFEEDYAKYFRSGSIKKIQKGLDLARSEGAFVFMPSQIMSAEQSVYMPVVDTVFLRDDEVYAAQKNFRIHYNGLLRMSIASSFEWSSGDCRRFDKQNDKLYCAYQAVGGVRKSDGRVYFHEAKDDVDIEVLEMEFEDKYSLDWEKVKGCTGDQAWKKHGHKSKDMFVCAMVRRDVIQKRKNMHKLAESGAKARVIRFILGLQGQYAKKNQIIGMPFVFVSFVMNQFHDAIKPLMMKSLPEAMKQIYGSSSERIIDVSNDRSDYDEVQSQHPDNIDLNDSEPENENTEQKPQASSKKGFKPEIKKEDTNLVDFQNISVDEQAKTLEQMCKDCGEDYKTYDKKGSGIKKADQEWRDGFFTWLKNEKENK